MPEPTEKEDKDNERYAHHLIDLIIHQDLVAQNFLKFLLTAEAGLVVAFAFFLRPETRPNGTQAPPNLYPIAIWLIPIMGIIIAVALMWVILSERKWQSWYVNKFNELPGCSGRIFPKNHPVDSPVTKMPLGTVEKAVIVLGTSTGVGWIVLLLAQLLSRH